MFLVYQEQLYLVGKIGMKQDCVVVSEIIVMKANQKGGILGRTFKCRINIEDEIIDHHVRHRTPVPGWEG